MLISTKGRYALRVLIDMAEHSGNEYIKLKDIAEAVQRNVKEKLQNMIGSAVTNVNVYVSDIRFVDSED